MTTIKFSKYIVLLMAGLGLLAFSALTLGLVKESDNTILSRLIRDGDFSDAYAIAIIPSEKLTQASSSIADKLTSGDQGKMGCGLSQTQFNKLTPISGTRVFHKAGAGRSGSAVIVESASSTTDITRALLPADGHERLECKSIKSGRLFFDLQLQLS